jgi:hypothetical protein
MGSLLGSSFLEPEYYYHHYYYYFHHLSVQPRDLEHALCMLLCLLRAKLPWSGMQQSRARCVRNPLSATSRFDKTVAPATPYHVAQTSNNINNDDDDGRMGTVFQSVESLERLDFDAGRVQSKGHDQDHDQDQDQDPVPGPSPSRRCRRNVGIGCKRPSGG